MSRWFRHYASLCRDEKLVSAAIKAKQPIERAVWVWCAILESAAEIDDAGRYGFDTAEAAYFLRADEADIVAIVSALEIMGRISGGSVAKWGNRQFSSDRSKDRVAAYRERQRSATAHVGQPEPSRNGGVTLQKRHRNAPEAETESDTDKESESASSVSPRDSCARSSRPDPAIIEARTAVANAYTSAGHLPPDTSRVSAWINGGFAPDEIASCVTAVLARGTVPSSLKYFDKPLAEARSAPRAPPPRAPRAKPKTASDYLSSELRKFRDEPETDAFDGITIDASPNA